MIGEEIKAKRETGDLIVGFKTVFKNIKKTEKVLLAKNCPKNLKEKLEKKDAELIETELNNKEIGTLCGKPFNVSVLGISKK